MHQCLLLRHRAGEDKEEGWEDGGDLEDDEGDSEGQASPTAPSFLFKMGGQGTGAPRWLHNDPSQPVMIAGRPYLVGGPAEAQARAR